MAGHGERRARVTARKQTSISMSRCSCLRKDNNHLGEAILLFSFGENTYQTRRQAKSIGILQPGFAAGAKKTE